MINYKGHPALKAVATEVPQGLNFSSELGLMWNVMYNRHGIGLAANQVQFPASGLRLIVVHAGGFKQAFINPVITKRYGGKFTHREGCLSFPGVHVLVVRDKQIIVEGFDENWKAIKRKLKGIAAYTVQHEVDHLDGITIA